MNKAGHPTYLNEDEESFLVASSDIEGDHGLPLYRHGVAQQLQNVFEAVNSWCGDYDIQEKSYLRHCREAIKLMNIK